MIFLVTRKDTAPPQSGNGQLRAAVVRADNPTQALSYAQELRGVDADENYQAKPLDEVAGHVLLTDNTFGDDPPEPPEPLHAAAHPQLHDRSQTSAEGSPFESPGDHSAVSEGVRGGVARERSAETLHTRQ